MARILLVDDEPTLCRIVQRMLEADSPNEVLVAHDGKAGLRLATKELPDLILLDVSMPGMDGLTVLQKLGEDRKTKYIPVIMLTGDDSVETKREAMQGFAEQYLVKPVTQEKLLATVNRVLAAGSGPA
jgi:twitching motility two-component system response regulator PilH